MSRGDPAPSTNAGLGSVTVVVGDDEVPNMAPVFATSGGEASDTEKPNGTMAASPGPDLAVRSG